MTWAPSLSHGLGILKFLTKTLPMSKSRSDDRYGEPLGWGKLGSDENNPRGELKDPLTGHIGLVVTWPGNVD